MVEPKLPKLKHLKVNEFTNKIMIPIGDSTSVMVDPEYFGFHFEGTQTGGHIVVNKEYTPDRFASNVSFRSAEKDLIIEDCIALSNYSKKYQKYLRTEAPSMVAVIECKKVAKYE